LRPFPPALLVLALSGRALADDRVAVEILAGEGPRDAVWAYERACWRLGVLAGDIRPVQEFEHSGARFARLLAQGQTASRTCLGGLEAGRRGIDGAFRWFDGFEGGAVVNGPATETPDRVPDATWYDPQARPPAGPPTDLALVRKLQSGAADAFEALASRAVPEALGAVSVLAAASGNAAQIALARIASGHPHWRVRRAAVEALAPEQAPAALAPILSGDPAWEVRHAAVEALGIAADEPDPDGARAGALLLSTARSDAAWEVRRSALWQLSSERVRDAARDLGTLARTDPDARVRAATLEVLAGASSLSSGQARSALADDAAEVRAAGAAILAATMGKDDLAPLWKAMSDGNRPVRLAAGALAEHLDDPTLGPAVWKLYVREAEELYADIGYLRVLAAFLGRNPYSGLMGEAAGRLGRPLAPEERRVIFGLLARIAPEPMAAELSTLLAAPVAEVRAAAAEAVPDTPASRARRLELLGDESADVRASAVLGLCSIPGYRLPKDRTVDLEPRGLGAEAAVALPRCGVVAGEPKRFQTRLAETRPGDGAPTRGSDGLGAALAAIGLLFASVLGNKLVRRPQE